MTYKHQGLTLDEKLSFTNCIDDKINKTLNSVGLLRKLRTLTTAKVPYYLQIPYKIPLGLWDVIYDQPLNESFSNIIESVQYEDALAITATV